MLLVGPRIDQLHPLPVCNTPLATTTTTTTKEVTYNAWEWDPGGWIGQELDVFVSSNTTLALIWIEQVLVIWSPKSDFIKPAQYHLTNLHRCDLSALSPNLFDLEDGSCWVSHSKVRCFHVAAFSFEWFSTWINELKAYGCSRLFSFMSMWN